MENPIISAMTQYGFQTVDPYVCVGTWKTYAVTLRRFTAQSLSVNLAVRLGKPDKALRKTLRAAVKAAGLKKCAVNNVQANTITAAYNPGRDGDAAGLTALLDLLTATLRENGVGPADTCAVTGAARPDSLCMLRNQSFFGFQPVCAAALRQQDNALREKVEENENNGSYLTGFLGALLGTAAGIGFNLLTIIFLQRIYVLLFAVIPIAAMFGYKLFKGKTDKLALVIVIVLSLAAVPALEYLSTALFLVKENGAPFGEALHITGQYFFESDFLRESIPEMLKMLLFMALGVVFAWAYMREQLNYNKIKGSRLQLDSLRPNPLYAPVAVPAEAAVEEVPGAEMPAEEAETPGEETL